MDSQAFGDTHFFQISSEECHDLIRSYFPDSEFSGKRVLDAGCRLGEFSAAFHALGAQVVAVDLSESCIAQAKETNPAIAESFHVANIAELSHLASHAFDLIFCVGVMPYLPVTLREPVIDGFKQLLAPHGKALVVFQQPKPRWVQLIADGLSRLPLPVYRLVVASLMTRALYPWHPKIMGRKMDYSRFRYILGYGIRGIHFGYPSSLEQQKIPTPSAGIVDPLTSISFLVCAE
jgi:SAM-dependent methyltransferase